MKERDTVPMSQVFGRVDSQNKELSHGLRSYYEGPGNTGMRTVRATRNVLCGKEESSCLFCRKDTAAYAQMEEGREQPKLCA